MDKENYCTIEELIQRIKQRPGMYVHEVRLDYVYYLIFGHNGCASQVKIRTQKDVYFQTKFFKWLINWARENWNKDYSGQYVFWYQIIDQNTNSPEESVTKFIELAEQFFSEYEEEERNDQQGQIY